MGPSVKHSLDVKDRESCFAALTLIDYLTRAGLILRETTSSPPLSPSVLLVLVLVQTAKTAKTWRIPWEEPSKPVVMEVDPRDDGAVRAVRPPYYTLPAFCTIPEKDKRANKDLEANIRLWIEGELQSRCQPERMWLPCERKRSYAPFLPCPQQLKDAIAFDLAVARGWCDFNHPVANIQPLESVAQPRARFTSTDRPSERDKPRVRIASSTVYADAPFVRRLMKRLYSKDHYYAII